MSDAPVVEIADWKHDAQFVYSMTYDEATICAIVNAYPIHAHFGTEIPGHVCAVSGYLGTQRIERGTSMREVFHMSPEQLRFLIDRGWTVSSHSHSHCPTDQEGIDLDLEVRLSKWELEQATGAPVRLFAYWNNLALADQILPRARDAGYLGILSIGHPFNGPDFDEWDIARGTVGRDMEMWLQEPTQSMYHHTRDAFPGQLTRENTRGKWLVDITHLVVDRLPPASPDSLWNRCSTPAIVEARLREVRELWGDRLWAAVPEDVVDYTLMRRAASVTVEQPSADRTVCTVHLASIPEAVQRRELTFRASVPWSAAEVSVVGADSSATAAPVPSEVRQGVLLWTAAVYDGVRFVLTP